jgi:hypothetical protein
MCGRGRVSGERVSTIGLSPPPLSTPFCSEAAQEKGIVFIIDFRDSQLTDIRYTSNVVSVLKDGYPIHTKDVYVVSHKRINKVINALQKIMRHDYKVCHYLIRYSMTFPGDILCPLMRSSPYN